MTTKQTAPRRRGRLGALDVLRLGAALLVVGFHLAAENQPGWGGPLPESLVPIGHWTTYGRLGVPLFFVISGFVLLMSSWGRSIPQFVSSRVSRLFPAYWVAVAFSFVMALWIWPESREFFGKEITGANGLLNLTMVHTAFGQPDLDGPYWTLWYEARFYALIVVLMMIGITRNRVLAFCALWPVVGSVASNLHADLIAGILMPDYAPFFAGGMLLYLIYRDGHDLGTWLLVGLQVLIGLNFSVLAYPEFLSHEVPWETSKVGIGIASVLCFGLVALVTLTPLARLSAGWMTLAGALTYPLYLIHQNLGFYLIHQFRERVGSGMAVAIAVAAALIASVLLHYLVEKPLAPRLRQAVMTTLTKTGRTADSPAATPAPAAPAPAAPAPAADVAPVAALDEPVGPLPRPRTRAVDVPHHDFARVPDSRGAGVRVPGAWGTQTRGDDAVGDRRREVTGQDAWPVTWPSDREPTTQAMPAQPTQSIASEHGGQAPRRHARDEAGQLVTGQS